MRRRGPWPRARLRHRPRDEGPPRRRPRGAPWRARGSAPRPPATPGTPGRPAPRPGGCRGDGSRPRARGSRWAPTIPTVGETGLARRLRSAPTLRGRDHSRRKSRVTRRSPRSRPTTRVSRAGPNASTAVPGAAPFTPSGDARRTGPRADRPGRPAARKAADRVVRQLRPPRRRGWRPPRSSRPARGRRTPARRALSARATNVSNTSRPVDAARARVHDDDVVAPEIAGDLRPVDLDRGHPAVRLARRWSRPDPPASGRPCRRSGSRASCRTLGARRDRSARATARCD